MTDDDAGETISTAQAADRLGVTVAEVLRRIVLGQITARRVSGGTTGPWAIPLTPFLDYLDGRHNGSSVMTQQVRGAQLAAIEAEAYAENARRDRDAVIVSWHHRGAGPTALAAATGERDGIGYHQVNRIVASAKRGARTTHNVYRREPE